MSSRSVHSRRLYLVSSLWELWMWPPMFLSSSSVSPTSLDDDTAPTSANVTTTTEKWKAVQARGPATVSVSNTATFVTVVLCGPGHIKHHFFTVRGSKLYFNHCQSMWDRADVPQYLDPHTFILNQPISPQWLHVWLDPSEVNLSGSFQQSHGLTFAPIHGGMAGWVELGCTPKLFAIVNRDVPDFGSGGRQVWNPAVFNKSGQIRLQLHAGLKNS